MIKYILSFCLALFVGSIAHATNIKVRAAEHDGFTRVVLNYGEISAPIAKPISDGIRVTFGTDVTFDLDAFFDRLSKNRLKPPKVNARQNEIEFDFDCQCGFAQFTERGNLLVLDISEGAYVPSAPKNTNSIAAQPSIDLPITTRKPIPKISSDTNIKSAESIVETQLRKALEHSLAKSILDRNPSPKITHSMPAAIDDHVSVFKTNGSGSFATNVNRPQTSNGRACIPNADLNFDNWGDSDTSFYHQLSIHRDTLVSDLGLFNHEAEEDLVKFYLYFGFATEALEILEPRQDTHKLQYELAKIMKGTTIETSDFFRDMYSCPSKVSIWGILAAGADVNKKMLDKDALQMAIIALPKPMLGVIGPRLTETLVDLGLTEIAQLLVNHIETRSPELKHVLTVTKSKIDIQNGETDAAAQKLELVIDSASSVSPAAMNTLIDLKLDTEAPVSARTADLAEALAWENKGTSLHSTLLQSETLARALQGDFDAAQAKFAESPKTPEFVDDFATLILDKAPDASFLKFVLGSDLSISPKSSTQDKIAKRLKAMGFSEEAAKFAPRPEPTADETEIDTAQQSLKDIELPDIQQIAKDDLLKTTRSMIESSAMSRQEFRLKLANSTDNQ